MYNIIALMSRARARGLSRKDLVGTKIRTRPRENVRKAKSCLIRKLTPAHRRGSTRQLIRIRSGILSRATNTDRRANYASRAIDDTPMFNIVSRRNENFVVFRKRVVPPSPPPLPRG